MNCRILSGHILRKMTCDRSALACALIRIHYSNMSYNMDTFLGALVDFFLGDLVGVAC